MTENSSHINHPDNDHYPAEDEIDIIDLIRPLWQQKILIFVITFVIIAIAVVMVLRATPQYKIFTQLKAGTLRWDKDGTPKPYMTPGDVKNLLSGGLFNTYTSKIGLEDNAPKISIVSNRQGCQLTATIFWPDPVKGKKILSGYIDFLNKTDRNNNAEQNSGLQIQRNILRKSIIGVNEKIAADKLAQQKVELTIKQKEEELKLIDVKSGHLGRKIERINVDIKMMLKQVQFLKEQIKAAEEARNDYEKSRRKIEENTTKIISLRDQLLQAPPDDSLQLLLLASTIQQNIAYLNTISQKIVNTRQEIISHRTAIAELAKKQEKSHLTITDLQIQIDSEIPKLKSDIQKEIINLQWKIDKEITSRITLREQQIGSLNDKIKTISLIEVIEWPQASTKPVKPNKKKIVALAGILGGFLAVICAYIRYFWLNNRDKFGDKLNNNTSNA
ncbi:MAG TPA: hypothetical protein EYP64_05265 [Desulfarculaceae bacterium]|nr:hypothetical protein [Desulfarculaceae bacterium]